MGLFRTLGCLLVLVLSALALLPGLDSPARADATATTTGKRAGLDWWSLQPPREHALPAVRDASWAINPIDRFVLAKLESAGLRPSPEADRRTLIRRVTFDLTGLPPAPQDVEQFVADASPGAYAKLVDRLLASPAYGERWARHWLDVVRYGESHGFERDQLRPNAWPYRDWVIAALNADMPYDRFVRLQIAGDVVAPEDPTAAIATGFLVAGPYDDAGQSQQSLAMRAVVRADEMEDVVGVAAQTFLGLTAHCARCHDHKFDPISQADYFRLVSALSGVRQGERSIAPSGEARRQVAEAEARVVELRRQLAAIDEPARRRVLAAKRLPVAPAPPAPVARWSFDDDFHDSVGALHGTPHGPATRDAGRLKLDGRHAHVVTVPLAAPLREKTLEAWVSLADVKQSGGGVISVQALDGSGFDAIVFGEREPGAWMAGSEGFVRYQSFGGTPESQPVERLHVAITYAADGTITAYRDGRPYGKPYKSSGPRLFEAGQAQLLFGMRHAPPGGNRMLEGFVHLAHLYDRALTPDEVARSAGALGATVLPSELAAELSPQDRATREATTAEIAALESIRQRVAQAKSYAVVPRQPEAPTRVELRGNPALPGEVVAPGGLTALPAPAADFGLPPDAPEAARRARLADWVASPQNPLTARVIVNRLWHYHFGAGIVETPNDFGFNGARPTHPELLDWLALELVRTGWSLKSLHRTIVTSATYRQSSRHDPKAAATDAEARLLWRKNPVRLSAEDVRDAVLSVAGQLNPAAGGPGFQDFAIRESNSTFYDPIDPVGPQFNRRSIYRTWARSGTNRFLDVFDCPDPSTTTPKRVVTTTPLQALALMNNAFVLRMSDRLADRAEAEAGDDVARQVERLYALAYGRAPDAEEIDAAATLAREHGLAALGRVVFNSNEFLYVD
jgi:hypothetical protein